MEMNVWLSPVHLSLNCTGKAIGCNYTVFEDCTKTHWFGENELVMQICGKC